MSEVHERPGSVAERVRDALKQTTIGEPHTAGGLTLFPLLSDQWETPICHAFDALADSDAVEITEVSAAGRVARVRAVNRGQRALLLLDGEEVLGGKQNRIINVTVVVPAGMQVEVPVSCVERGRWGSGSPGFCASGRAMFAEGRAKKMRHVTHSLRERGEAETDQGAVWDDVASHLRAYHVSSETDAMSAAWDAHGAEIDESVEAFPSHDRQVGAIFAARGRIAGLELFDTPETWRASAPKLIRSYALDLASAASGAAASLADAETFRDAVLAARCTTHPAVGAGLLLRFEDGIVTGGGLVWAERLIHLSAFQVAG